MYFHMVKTRNKQLYPAPKRAASTTSVRKEAEKGKKV